MNLDAYAGNRVYLQRYLQGNRYKSIKQSKKIIQNQTSEDQAITKTHLVRNYYQLNNNSLAKCIENSINTHYIRLHNRRMHKQVLAEQP